jgi:protein arginine N-methyltransferase 7
MFWFDLHLDEEETLTTAPPGFSFGGKPEEDLLAELDTLLADLEATEAGGEPSENAENKSDEPAPAPIPDKTAFEGLSGGLLDRCHYWGHGLQYFERAVKVSAGGKRVALLVKRDGPRYFSCALYAALPHFVSLTHARISNQ